MKTLRPYTPKKHSYSQTFRIFFPSNSDAESKLLTFIKKEFPNIKIDIENRVEESFFLWVRKITLFIKLTSPSEEDLDLCIKSIQRSIEKYA